MRFSKWSSGVERAARLGAAPLAALICAAAGCTDVNVLPTDEGDGGSPTVTPPAGGTTTTPPPAGQGGNPSVTPPAGGATAAAGAPPIAVPADDELIGVNPGGEAEGYEELAPLLASVGAADANGHTDQTIIAGWFAAGAVPTDVQRQFLFDMGDELSEIPFTNSDGVGATIGANGNPILTFNRVPQDGRFTGPNATACIACHDQPLGNGAGLVNDNVLQDPLPLNATPFFNERNSRNINGGAWLQQLAIEMTLELQTQAAAIRTAAAGTAEPLTAKGISFGTLSCAAGPLCDYSGVEGVSPDLAVRPYGWKGNVPTLRFFVEDAFNGELGMQSDRVAYANNNNGALVDNLTALTLADLDNDGDGVAHEVSIGDVTALTFYFASQARPVPISELVADPTYEIVDADGAPVTVDNAAITAGETMFNTLGCNGCHVPSLNVTETLFSDPDSRVLEAFPAGTPGEPGAVYVDTLLEATVNGYTLESPILLDLGSDDLVLERSITPVGTDFPVAAFTDLKRHDLGGHLCDFENSVAADGSFRGIVVPSDSMDPNLEVEIDLCEFLTPPLWGISGTAPYMHDGRSQTITAAILQHCGTLMGGGGPGEANQSCLDFTALGEGSVQQANLIAFLHSLTSAPEP